MSMPLGGARYSTLIAISIAPSINFTSHKKNAVAAYTLTRTLDNAVDTVTSATFNGKPTYVLTQTTQPDCQGDEAGIGGGVKSGTVGKEVKPTSGSSSILIEGKSLVRENDTCTMNNENTVGKYISYENMSDGQRKALADNTAAANSAKESGDGLPSLSSDSDEALNKKEIQKVIDMIDLSSNSYFNADDIPKEDIPEGYNRLSKEQIEQLDLDPALFSEKGDLSGYYATMYEKDGNYVIAMRGTEPKKLNDWYTDFAQGIGLPTTQYDKANKLAGEMLKNPLFNSNNMTITGHSLGGGLAATVGSITGYPTYTFNAAGVHQNTLNRYSINEDQTRHIQAYNSDSDPLNLLQDHREVVIAGIGTQSPIIAATAQATGAIPRVLGQRTTIKTPGSILSDHGTSGMKEVLEQSLKK